MKIDAHSPEAAHNDKDHLHKSSSHSDSAPWLITADRYVLNTVGTALAHLVQGLGARAQRCECNCECACNCECNCECHECACICECNCTT